MTTTQRAATVAPDRALRASLRLDAAASAGLGAIVLTGAAALDTVVGLPAAGLVALGAFLLAYGAGVWRVGRPPRISRPATGMVIVGNLLWTVASLAVAAADPWSMTTPGRVLVVVQAAAVALFAALQLAAVRRPT